MKTRSAFPVLLALFVPCFQTVAAPPGYWEIRPSPTSADLHAITYEGGRYLAVGAQGTVLISSNGSQWAAYSLSSTNRLRSVVHANGLFIAGGEGGNLLNSSGNGIHWTNQLSTSGTESIHGLAHANGRFVGVGNLLSSMSGQLHAYTVASTNGFNWQSRSPTTNGLRAVAFGNGIFVAVGNFGTILTSSDGLAWIAQTSPITNDLMAIAYLPAGKFIASGMFGFSVGSTDGTNWSEISRASFSVRGLACGGGYVVGVGRSQNTGRIQQYADPFGWPGESLVLPNLMNGVAFGNNNWVAVGEQGIIVQAHVPRLTLAPAGTQLDLLLTGPAGRYRIDHSTNLTAWSSLGVFQFSTPPNNAYVLRADNPAHGMSSYFRASFLPP